MLQDIMIISQMQVIEIVHKLQGLSEFVLIIVMVMSCICRGS